MIQFKNEQVFLITGASSGIGKETALLLNSLGATTIATARNEKRLSEMKLEAKQACNMHIEIKELTEDIQGLPQFIKSIKDKYGKLQGLVNCAGIVDINPLQLLDFSDVQKVYNINLFAPLFLTKGVADKRNNIGKGTSIVHVSSMGILTGNRGHSTYVGAKSALSNSMRSIAKELASRRIRVNCVLPSDIETPMTDRNGDFSELVEKRLTAYPMGIGQPIDVANMIAFLLSDKSEWITGQNYIIDCASI